MVLLEEAAASQQAHAESVEDEVRRACREVSYAWSRIETQPLEQLVAMAGWADLVLISQPHPADPEDPLMEQLPEQLPIQAPCPVLILPGDGPVPTLPGQQHVLVAWKNCREAGRAIRDALPFLRTADRVTVLTVDPALNRQSDANDILVFLERHGIQAEFLPGDGADNEAGEVILAVAQEQECDLIVMGGYGHSRLRDLVLGSATHTVLSHMRIPVLMAY
ncbi:hypothetical protein CCP1ISM_510007 [Azospirillaceae bacterium]